jgi:dolichol-phosphate mannosyltransferase
MSQKESDLCIFIPTYNEIKNIEEIHRRIRAEFPLIDILFIDDGSPDGTGAKLDEIAKADGRITVLHREGKKGIGSAHKAAFKWAYENSVELLLTMDSDLTHKPEEIVKFLGTMEKHDVTVGSRFLSDQGIAEWPLGRRVITNTGHFLTRHLLGTNVDSTGAFRLYNLKKIQPKIFGCIDSDDYAFFYESIKILQVAGVNVGEVPVTLSARFRGHSKMKPKDMVRGFTYLISFAVRVRLPKSKINQQIKNIL